MGGGEKVTRIHYIHESNCQRTSYINKKAERRDIKKRERNKEAEKVEKYRIKGSTESAKLSRLLEKQTKERKLLGF